ncbi:50S ribosomal protein L18 [Candidatus Marinamargulisbacteria bacterium SCGC AG-343-D04]|nr:50S ribosomal protein L18 [Candidatus Marinamargulisbacteria bacterium SCGC AG-343-D04]
MSKNTSKIDTKLKKKLTKRYRLSVYKSNLNIFAQIIDDGNGVTLVSANSLKMDKGTKTEKSIKVGEELALRAVESKIDKIYLDRKNLRFTGCLKSLCDSARHNGLKF